MPIYIDCKDDNMVSLLNQENFTAFFIKYLDKWQLPSERKEEIIYQRIKSGRILLVVDGFDNLDSERYQDVAERIKSYDEQVQSSMKILITSRVEFVGISQSSRINLTEFSQIKVIKLAMT